MLDEGDPFNNLKLEQSVARLDSKNIFGEVTTKILDGSVKNQKIIDIKVEEKPTGEISAGAGVGTSGGLVSFGVRENNYLGKGIKLNSSLKLGEDTIRGQFSIVQPNFRYSDRALFTSISRSSTDKLTTNGYKSELTAFSLGTRYEQYDDLYFSPTISSVFESLTTSGTASSSLKKQEGNYFDSYFNYSLDYDLTNKRFRPDEGFRNIFQQELPVISDNYEIVNSFESTRYQKISEMVTKVSFYGKAVNSLGNEDVRISKRLFMPSSKLRGFESGKIGPLENNDYIGGNYISALNFSATLPKFLPSFQNIDFSLFVDAANVWGVDYDSAIDDNNKIRSSTGVAMDLLTPIGPLNFSLSQPITKNSTDKTESFRFNLGTTF